MKIEKLRMQTIKQLLSEIELHDSSLIWLKMNIDGSLVLNIDIDDVWNNNLPKEIKGVVFNSVFEITAFKMDRVNIIGTIEIENISDYNKEFIIHSGNAAAKVVRVSIEFVAGGHLVFIGEDIASYLK